VYLRYLQTLSVNLAIAIITSACGFFGNDDLAEKNLQALTGSYLRGGEKLSLTIEDGYRLVYADRTIILRDLELNDEKVIEFSDSIIDDDWIFDDECDGSIESTPDGVVIKSRGASECWRFEGTWKHATGVALVAVRQALETLDYSEARKVLTSVVVNPSDTPGREAILAMLGSIELDRGEAWQKSKGSDDELMKLRDLALVDGYTRAQVHRILLDSLDKRSRVLCNIGNGDTKCPSGTPDVNCLASLQEQTDVIGWSRAVADTDLPYVMAGCWVQAAKRHATFRDYDSETRFLEFASSLRIDIPERIWIESRVRKQLNEQVQRSLSLGDFEKAESVITRLANSPVEETAKLGRSLATQPDYIDGLLLHRATDGFRPDRTWGIQVATSRRLCRPGDISHLCIAQRYNEGTVWVQAAKYAIELNRFEEADKFLSLAARRPHPQVLLEIEKIRRDELFTLSLARARAPEAANELVKQCSIDSQRCARESEELLKFDLPSELMDALTNAKIQAEGQIRAHRSALKILKEVEGACGELGELAQALGQCGGHQDEFGRLSTQTSIAERWATGLAISVGWITVPSQDVVLWVFVSTGMLLGLLLGIVRVSWLFDRRRLAFALALVVASFVFTVYLQIEDDAVNTFAALGIPEKVQFDSIEVDVRACLSGRHRRLCRTNLQMQNTDAIRRQGSLKRSSLIHHRYRT
jgi:hypothetical protein